MEKKQIISMEIWENVDDLFLEGEIFKDIEEYPDYQVSNFGRIKSFKKWHGTDVRILKQTKDENGRLFVSLYKNKKPENKYIHRLLFETFNNYKIKKGECVHHLDKNILNNNFDNFQLMTLSEHMSLHNSGKKHSNKTKQLMSEKMSGKNNPRGMLGKNHSNKTKELMKKNHTDFSGENNPASILTDQNVIEIWKYLDKNELTHKEIGKLFGVHESTISRIKNRRIWKHIIKNRGDR